MAGEEVLCTGCRAGLNSQRMHYNAYGELRQRLMPRTAPIVMVDAYGSYTNASPIGQLIRRAKYDNRPDIAAYLAQIYARKLIADGMLEDVDLLQPIPMHWLKRLSRGYNQTEVIATTISRETGIPVAKVLRASKSHSSQTGHSAAERVRNVEGVFSMQRAEQFTGKHVAIIDDIITTGSTISSAISAIMPAEPSKITILALAATIR